MKGYIKILLMALFVYIAAPVLTYLLITQISASPTLSSVLPLVVNSPSKDSFSNWYLVYTIIGIIAASFVFTRFYKQKSKIKAFYSLYTPFAIGISTAYIFIALFYASLPPLVGAVILFLMLVGVAYLYYKQRMKYFNLFGIIIAVGMASYIGILITPLIAVAMLVVYAIYDYIAVYVTKHMQNIVAVAIDKDSPMPMMITSEDPRALAERLTKLQTPQTEAQKLAKKPPLDKMSLGLGDLILPAIIPVSLLVANPQNFIWTLAILGATVGVGANILALNYTRKAIPAIPLLTVFTLLFVGLGFLI